MGALLGKVALVTGSSRGIGRAIAFELARAGADVALNYRTGEAEAHEAAREIRTAGRRAIAIQADVSKSDEARSMVSRVLAEFGRLDILVNNAGITRDRTLRRMSDDDWHEVLETNLSSAFFSISAALPAMVDQKYGRIVNVSSVVGQAGNFGQANYAAAKAGLIAFTKTAAQELARFNVTVNAIAPGFTATDMVQRIPENVQEQIKARIPLSRFGRPEEVARAVLFLVLDGDYITGQQINVNGGFYM